MQHGQDTVVFVTPRGSSTREARLEVSESVVDFRNGAKYVKCLLENVSGSIIIF